MGRSIITEVQMYQHTICQSHNLLRISIIVTIFDIFKLIIGYQLIIKFDDRPFETGSYWRLLQCHINNVMSHHHYRHLLYLIQDI